MSRIACVVGTCDTKGDELLFVKRRLVEAGIEVVLIDIGIRSSGALADVSPREVASHHPAGEDAVFVNDRGAAVAAMGEALLRFVEQRDDIAAMIGLGGSGGTSMVTRAMRRLPIGIPKVMVSAVAASDIRPYIGLSDIVMVPSITDIDRVNRLSKVILGNAAGALIGMLSCPKPTSSDDKPAVGITTAGVTTECQERVMDLLEATHECLSFHAAGTGGPTMEMLVESGMLEGVIDLATTEVTDYLLGGSFACDGDRLDRIARSEIPYVGSCGALDCWKFRSVDTVPDACRHRTIYEFNPEVTLIRPSEDEFTCVGRWLGEKLNAMSSPVRFLLPEGGLSTLDAPGRPFYAPEINEALFRALESSVEQTEQRQLVRLPFHINDPEFADALVVQFVNIIDERRASG